jgi:hypothetical protein
MRSIIPAALMVIAGYTHEASAQLVDCERLSAAIGSGRFTAQQVQEMSGVYEKECSQYTPPQQEVPQQPVEPPTLTFTLSNRTGVNLEVTFKSQNRDSWWPGNDQVYLLNNGQTGSYKLTCFGGEYICYGATSPGFFASRYWGSGSNHENACSNCCYVCGPNVQTGEIGLTP